VAQAAAVGRALVAGIEAAAKALGYGVLVAYALPACARHLARDGWEMTDDRPKVAMMKIL
jgi:hypothetical protein